MKRVGIGGSAVECFELGYSGLEFGCVVVESSVWEASVVWVAELLVWVATRVWVVSVWRKYLSWMPVHLNLPTHCQERRNVFREVARRNY